MKIIDIKDSLYPLLLKKIKNPPQKLYAKGNLELLNKPGIAIIGSRKATEYGEKVTKKFAEELSLYGLTIISGMAEGVDSFAHISCLQVLGSTIAVLPCGFNNIFPNENIDLYNQILENNGLVITEYEENEKASSNKFLERNRIVAGLGIGTLVVEGAYRSGTSVTARLTKEQGKNIFCIPSSIYNPQGVSPNNLIKKGAILVTEAEDIIKQYSELKLKKRNIQRKELKIKIAKKAKDENIPSEFKQIYDLLDFEIPIHINQIAKKTGINIQEISSKLMMLEIENKVVSLPGNYYKIAD